MAPSEVYENLKQDIIRFAFKPGQRLFEGELCERYGVSRTPIREAMWRLEQEGLIEPRRNGRFVPEFNVSQYEDMYDVRIALEVLAVAQACDRAKDHEIVALQESWESGLEPAIAALDGSYVTGDERFHKGLVDLAHNVALTEALSRIYNRIHIIRMVDFTSDERISRTREQHNAVLDSIQQRDVAATQRQIRAHIEESQASIRQMIERAVTRIYVED